MDCNRRGNILFSVHRSVVNFKNGGDLKQIRFLLGHCSLQTSERYLGLEQGIAVAVNDNMRL